MRSSTSTPSPKEFFFDPPTIDEEAGIKLAVIPEIESDPNDIENAGLCKYAELMWVGYLGACMTLGIAPEFKESWNQNGEFIGLTIRKSQIEYVKGIYTGDECEYISEQQFGDQTEFVVWSPRFENVGSILTRLRADSILQRRRAGENNQLIDDGIFYADMKPNDERIEALSIASYLINEHRELIDNNPDRHPYHVLIFDVLIPYFTDSLHLQDYIDYYSELLSLEH